jgi:hypothetical protein
MDTNNYGTLANRSTCLDKTTMTRDHYSCTQAQHLLLTVIAPTRCTTLPGRFLAHLHVIASGRR